MATRTGRYAVTLIALVLFGCTHAEVNQDPRQSKFDSLLDKNYKEAVDVLDKELKEHPDSLQAEYFRATVEAEKGNMEDGITRLTKLLERYPNYAFGYSERSRVNFIAGHFDQALADADLAIRYRPDMARFYPRRALAYLRLQQPDKALDDLATAARLDPKEDPAYVGLLSGQAYMDKHQYKEALDYFNRSIEHSKKPNLHLYMARAVCWAHLRQWKQALADSEEAIKLAPHDPQASLLHCSLLSATGKRDASRKEFATALKANQDKRLIADTVDLGEDIPSVADAASACETINNPALAKSVLMLVESHRPLDPEEMFALAKAEQGLKDYFRACKLLNECLAEEPTWPEPRVELIKLYLQDNLPQKARDVQKEGLELALSPEGKRQVQGALR